jgi:hypothetical protein
MQAVRTNFGVDVDDYVRLRFDGFSPDGGCFGRVDVVLPAPMSGYPAGVTIWMASRPWRWFATGKTQMIFTAWSTVRSS